MPKKTEEILQLDVASFDFLTFYKSLKKGSNKDFVLLSKDPKQLFGLIKNKLTIIKAAGGLVENAKGEFLFIFRNKKWDLPKGKVEKNEKIKVTTGLKDYEVVEILSGLKVDEIILKPIK